MNEKQLILIGAGGQAKNAANVAALNGFSLYAFVDKEKCGRKLFGVPILESLTDVKNKEAYQFFIAIGDNSSRERVYENLILENPDLAFATLVDKTASISPFSKIGRGTIIMPQSIVGASSKIGDFCILGNNSVIAHDNIVSDFCSVGPSVTTGGNVTLRRKVALGIGSTIKNKVSIGRNTIIGANSFLNKDIGEGIVAYGSPARKIRARGADEPYL